MSYHDRMPPRSVPAGLEEELRALATAVTCRWNAEGVAAAAGADVQAWLCEVGGMSRFAPQLRSWICVRVGNQPLRPPSVTLQEATAHFQAGGAAGYKRRRAANSANSTGSTRVSADGYTAALAAVTDGEGKVALRDAADALKTAPADGGPALSTLQVERLLAAVNRVCAVDRDGRVNADALARELAAFVGAGYA
jgi:hypothetical protein